MKLKKFILIAGLIIVVTIGWLGYTFYRSWASASPYPLKLEGFGDSCTAVVDGRLDSIKNPALVIFPNDGINPEDIISKLRLNSRKFEKLAIVETNGTPYIVIEYADQNLIRELNCSGLVSKINVEVIAN